MFPGDIIAKIKRDFENPDEVDLVLSVLADFVDQNQDLSSDRILRCIVFMANGGIDTLEKAMDLAKTDCRDSIVWAEYDKKAKRIRDFSDAFS